MTCTAHRLFSTLVILGVTAGCDNVTWGGVDVSLQGPPERDPPPEDSASAEPALPALPEGPVVFRVDVADGQARLSPVGEVVPGALADLTSEADAPGFRDHFVDQRVLGQEFVLFADGIRVGRFLPGDSVGVDGEACPQPPSVAGVIEVVPEAADRSRFLAMEQSRAPAVPRGPISTTVVDQRWRVNAANVAGTVIMDAGARWPPSMGRARGDVQVVPFQSDEPPILTGTYLYQDQMAIVEAPPASYSLFFMSEDRGQGYRYSYYWFRVTGSDGKGAARYFDHLDWDGDGSQNVLLEVLGADARWHAALARTPEGFQLTYQDACGTPEQQAPAAP